MKIFKVGTILCIMYVLVAWFELFSMGDGISSNADAIEKAIGAVIIIPHLIVASVGAIFNVLAYKDMRKDYILAACILYSLAVILCIFWAFLLIPGMILIWIVYSKISSDNFAIS